MNLAAKRLLKLSGRRPTARAVAETVLYMQVYIQTLLVKLIYIASAAKSQTITLEMIKFIHVLCPEYPKLYGDPEPQMPRDPFKKFLNSLVADPAITLHREIRFGKGARAAIQQFAEMAVSI